MFNPFSRKKKLEQAKNDKEFVVLKQEAADEVARIKAAKEEKVNRETAELIEFRRVIKKYGPDGIYFLAFGGIEQKGKR